MRVSVIIPVFNALPLARECVGSIFAAGSELSFEVIVVDNGSTPDVKEWLTEEERHHANLRHLRYGEPLGFARAVNAGASAATGEVIVILNSDTAVSPGWMDALHSALIADPSLGMVSPFTNHAGDTAQMDYRTIDLPLSSALALAAKKPSPPNIRYVPQRLTLFCGALRRAVWLEFGGLDEAYKVGNFEDDDLCMRLRVAGYRLAVAEHAFVYHHNNATFQANRIGHDTWMTRNAAIFADHARQFAEASHLPEPHWPKQSAPDISVVIQAVSAQLAAGAPLDRTLQSLQNQTVRDFEIILPDSSAVPNGDWVAYLAEGDILYPFHLEALRDALDRTSSEAVFSDGWIPGATEQSPHPDAAGLTDKATFQTPRMLAGWMHHKSFDPQRDSKPIGPLHWPRLTWEMQERPLLAQPDISKRSQNRVERSTVDWARSLYRRTVPIETRLNVDAGIRRLLRLPPAPPLRGRAHRGSAPGSMQEVADALAALTGSQTHSGKFAAETSLPDVFFFNIIPWNALVQRPHHFARGLANRGHRVFWIETGLSDSRPWWTGRPFEQVSPGVHLVNLPGPARDVYHMRWDPTVLKALSAALAQIASAYGIRQAISLVNFPRWEPLVFRARDQFGWKIIYDCLDDQRAFAEMYRTDVRNHEDRLMNDADLVLTSSAVLQGRMRDRRPAILLQNAADYGLFSSATPAGHLGHVRRPIIGFFGALADWLDVDLIRAAALSFPSWSFVYIGAAVFSNSDAQSRWLQSSDLPNITVLPQMDPETLAAHAAEFDVCTMPFLDVPVTRTMNAVKLYEYLAAGKPVVSRDLPEVRCLIAGDPESGTPGASDLISIFSTREQFFEQLRAAVVAIADAPDLARERQKFASQHDWSHRVDVLSREIVQVAGTAADYDTRSSNASSSGANTRSQE